MREGKAGRAPSRLIPFPAFFVVPGKQKRDALVPLRLNEIGIARECGLAGGDRLAGAALQAQQMAEARMRLGKRGIEGDRAPAERFGLGDAVLVGQEIAEIEMRLRVGGIARDRSLEPRDRRRRRAEPGERHRAQELGFRKRGREQERGVRRRERLRRPLRVQKCGGKSRVRGGVAGVGGDRRAIGFDRLGDARAGDECGATRRLPRRRARIEPTRGFSGF